MYSQRQGRNAVASVRESTMMKGSNNSFLVVRSMTSKDCDQRSKDGEVCGSHLSSAVDTLEISRCSANTKHDSLIPFEPPPAQIFVKIQMSPEIQKAAWVWTNPAKKSLGFGRIPRNLQRRRKPHSYRSQITKKPHSVTYGSGLQ
jgi:hypothetical protein